MRTSTLVLATALSVFLLILQGVDCERPIKHSPQKSSHRLPLKSSAKIPGHHPTPHRPAVKHSVTRPPRRIFNNRPLLLVRPRPQHQHYTRPTTTTTSTTTKPPKIFCPPLLVTLKKCVPQQQTEDHEVPDIADELPPSRATVPGAGLASGYAIAGGGRGNTWTTGGKWYGAAGGSTFGGAPLAESQRPRDQRQQSPLNGERFPANSQQNAIKPPLQPSLEELPLAPQPAAFPTTEASLYTAGRQDENLGQVYTTESGLIRPTEMPVDQMLAIPDSLPVAQGEHPLSIPESDGNSVHQ